MPHSHTCPPRPSDCKLPLANSLSTRATPRGFTLVELLLVIGIIGLLTGIAVPVVMQSLTKARNAAIKAEIDMLHMAIMNYKNEYGSFPPCDSLGGSSGLAAKHVRRIFPRWPLSGTADPRTPDTAIVRWLEGYTSDPTDPLGSGGGERKKLFDFDQSRISSAQYHPPGKPESPFIYINSDEYLWDHDNNSATQKVVQRFGDYFAQRLPGSPSGAFDNALQPAFNPDTFQILCAGRDGIFPSDDDLSNFWPGTRREYLDSLKN